jgi:hypothetical protein
MRLRASVEKCTGSAKHYRSTLVDGDVAPLELLPDPVTVEIEGNDTVGYLLLRLNRTNVCIADTWHESVEQAKDQAASEYGIPHEAWTLISE